MHTIVGSNADVSRAADELVARYGASARQTASERAATLAREGRWPEHDVALRVLTAVEGRLGGPS